MTPRQRIELAQSKRRERVSELLAIEDRSDDETAEMKRITDEELPAGEVELRAAIAAEPVSDGDGDGAPDGGDDPARVELRSACSILSYFGGRPLTGAEAELRDELGLADNQIPVELWQRPVETRAVSDPPANTGVNLDTLQPMVFAPSIAARLSVDMPMVASGSYASGTITTAATADAVARSGDVPETAAQFTSMSTDPHRVGGSVAFAAEDVAKVGAENFEALLREHISLVVSDHLDDLLINGDTSGGGGAANEIEGMLKRLADPSATLPESGTAAFDNFVAAFADGIDGLWASTMAEIAVVAGVDTYKLSAKAFRDGGNNHKGDTSAADYLAEHTAGWSTNKRMPAAASNVQAAILHRKGRSMTPAPMRTAVCPHWGYLTVDDIYTGARKGQRRYVVSALVGDLILTQPNAYAQVNFRTGA